MMEDETTDDELGVNLQLGERLQIKGQSHSSYHNTRAKSRNTKEHKEYWNGRKKDMCSTAVNPHCSESSTSVNGWFAPETPSPYQLGNKKRQNKDRNGEQIAKSKRTCFNVYPNWKEGKIRNRHYKDPQHCASIPKDSSGLPETSVKTEPSASASASGANDFSDVNGSGLDGLQKNISPDEKYRDFMENIPSLSEVDGTNSSSSNFSSVDLLHGSGNRNGNALKSFDASLSFPSTSNSGQSFTDTIQSSVSRATRSIPLGVQYIDSESDDSSRLYAKRGALKGGKQVESNHFKNKVASKCGAQVLESDNSDDDENIHYHNKVIGKCSRRVVESDDSDDSSWQPAFHKHRSRLLLSESEESIEEQSQSLISRTRGFMHLKNNSATSCNSRCSSYNNKKAPFIPLPCDEKSNDESDHFTSDCCRRRQGSVTHKSPKKSSRPRRGNHSKSVNKHFSSCDCNSPGPASQIKVRSCLRHHRSGSPHPRSLRQRRHSRGLSRTSSGQINNSSNQSIKTGLRKEFDAEDSSDVEFFSANSYSESETSESFGGIDISSTLSACPAMRSEGSRACERAINAPESSEDEVSVVFTANPPFRDGNNSRHRRHRGTARRRHSRVPSRGSRSQDPVSVSPDPVEQVRQMEEDERLARLLQAQFDAEVVSEECRPEAHHHHHHHIVDSDEYEEIDPVGDISDDMGWIYDESLQNESMPPDHHHHHTFSHSPTFLSPALHRGRARGRPRMAVVSFSTINNGSGRGRHVRRRYMHGGGGGIVSDPWMWQFARMMGQSVTGRSFDSEGADYEALWELAEDVGEAIPRGLNKSEINRLPTRKYVNNISGSDATSSKDFDETVHKRTELNKECQVCLCDYENGDLLRILPCFHEFHTACIDPWLKINHTCPVCRVEVDLEEN